MLIKDLNYIFNDKEKVSIALGFFDGVHLGHKKIIKSTFKSGFKSMVFTFDKKNNTNYIMDFETKISKISSFKPDYILAPNFYDFNNYSGEEFIKILYNNFNVRRIVCGDDFCFGKNRSFSIEDLREICKALSIELCVIEPLYVNNLPVSSTLIKQKLALGEIEKVNDLLGHTYYLSSIVRHGQKLGKTIERPTINQYFQEGQIIPKYGVYESVTKVFDKFYFSSTNIGITPTFKVDKPLMETYIYGFDGDLYDYKIDVYLFSYVRAEKFFNDIDELKKDILNVAIRSKNNNRIVK